MNSKNKFVFIFTIIYFICQLGFDMLFGTIGLVAPPQLKWQRAGRYSSWCQTGWYSSPAAIDLNNDGKTEIIGASYSVFAINGENGSLIWEVDPPGSRVWSRVVVCDLDNDGNIEIITAHGGGYLNVIDKDGHILWTRRPSTSEIRGLAVSDLDNNGTLEIVVNAAVSSKTNTWVYNSVGNLLPGWPQLNNTTGYGYGVFNDNASIGDINGDGIKDIIVPSDVHYICAYNIDGTQIQANSIYGNKKWGAVGIWESFTTELRGWGHCNGVRAESYRTNFAHGASVISDVDGDGIVEVIATGNVYNCNIGHPPGKYNGVYIFNSDRSRFRKGAYNWEAVPINTGAPLSED